MGIFGKLLSGDAATVEGRITVQNRPPDTCYDLSTFFFPSAPGAAAPADDALGHPAGIEADTKPSSSLHSDQGYMFFTALPAGHWQVVVLSRPYVVRERKAVHVAAMPTVHRPHPKAFQVLAGQPKHLALKLVFEPIPVVPEPPVALPFEQRIGPALRARYVRALRLAEEPDKAAALLAFEELALAPEVIELDPGTQAELRIAVETGRARCLSSP